MPLNLHVRLHVATPKVLRAFQSFRAAMRASAAFAEAQRALESGKHALALEIARTGLQVLNGRNVNRFGAAEGAALVSLTICAEQAGVTTFVDGAPIADLRDTEALLQRIVNQSGGAAPNAMAQLQYIKHRLAAKA